MSNVIDGEGVLGMPIEVFLSENGVCLAVPKGCGLNQADTLKVDVRNRTVVAIRAGSELPVDLPILSEAHCKALAVAGTVAVGEFVAQGVVAAYCLTVIE